jgi:Icc-related predicted phosphoesterase
VSEFLTLVALSDTHSLHAEVDVPPADLVVVAGDFTMFDRDPAVVFSFNAFLGDLKTKHKPLVIYGNHEFGFEADPSRRKLLSNATVLVNESVTIDGLKFWGSPVTTLYSGAFGMSNPKDRKALYETIDEDTDVIVTHGPPDTGEHAGDEELLERVMEVQPLLHIFGHVHAGYGMKRLGETLFINCALLGQGGGIQHSPIVIRLPRL